MNQTEPAAKVQLPFSQAKVYKVNPVTPHRRKPAARTPEDSHVSRLIFSDVTYTRDPAFKLSHGNISVNNQPVVGATTVLRHLQWLTGGRSNHHVNKFKKKKKLVVQYIYLTRAALTSKNNKDKYL